MDNSQSSQSGSSTYQYSAQKGGHPGTQPPPQPVTRKGFNWLACCGIGCVVLVLLGGVFAYVVFNTGRTMVAEYERVEGIAQAVQAVSIDQIKAAATRASTAELAAKPDVYDSAWVELTGVVSQPFDSSVQQQQNISGTEYYLGQNVFMLDVSGQPSVAGLNQQVRAWGQPAFVRMDAIPLVGPLMKMASQRDPTMPDLSTVILFYAREVELVESTEDGSQEPVAGTSESSAAERQSTDKSGQDAGWLP